MNTPHKGGNTEKKETTTTRKDSPITGKLDHKPTITQGNKTVCYWKGKAYSPGAEIKKGKRTYICNKDGTWGWVE